VWVVTRAESRIVGPWTLVWRICSFVWSSRHQTRSVSTGPDSLSSLAIGAPLITLTLEACPARSIFSAPRWLLTCEWGVYKDWGRMNSGPYSAECGDSWVDGGEGRSATRAQPTSISEFEIGGYLPHLSVMSG